MANSLREKSRPVTTGYASRFLFALGKCGQLRLLEVHPQLDSSKIRDKSTFAWVDNFINMMDGPEFSRRRIYAQCKYKKNLTNKTGRISSMVYIGQQKFTGMRVDLKIAHDFAKSSDDAANYLRVTAISCPWEQYNQLLGTKAQQLGYYCSALKTKMFPYHLSLEKEGSKVFNN